METAESCRVESPICAFVLEGERAAPPEDIGGADLYQEFLDGLKRNHRDPDVRDTLRWLGGTFDPDLFDVRATNATLVRMAVNGWGKR